MPARNATLAALGRAIREHRVERGLSQEELGFLSRLDRTYVGGLERGERNATYETLVKIADGMEVDLVAIAQAAERYRRGEPD